MARSRGGYGTVPQTRFSGGLNLTDGVDVVAPDQAIDLLNVVFLPQGGMRQRDGYQNFTSSALSNATDSLTAFYKSDGTRQLIAGNGNRLDVLSTAGASTANTTAPTASPHYFARFGAPGSEHVYIANGTDNVRRWTGAAFDAPAFSAVTPTGRYLAVQAVDNRLVVAREASFPDRVRFSDPGNPLIFQTNNFVDLRPGSGDPITAVIAWREYVFAFKETEFFVFYGNSLDSDGGAVFNFRPASSTAGSVGPVAAAPEGVYFMDRRGVWLTNGGEPKLVSPSIEPLFVGGGSLYYQGGSMALGVLANARMHYHQGRLYVAFSSSVTNNRLLVYAPEFGWWTLYDVAVGAMASFRPSTRDELLFGVAGTSHIARYFEGSGHLRDGLASDGTGGVAITSRWRQGWIDYGTQDQKGIRQTKLWGSGRVEMGIVRDFEMLPSRLVTVSFSGSGVDLWETGGPSVWGDGTDPTKTWGPANTPRPWLVSQSVYGHLLSLAVQNSTLDQTWALHRLEHGFRQGRAPEVLGRYSR